MKSLKSFWRDTGGDALVVEAAILFPILIMIFAALVLVSMYLPQRAILQEAAQVAAVTIATERSDTWVGFDDSATYVRKSSLPNVYVAAVQNVFFNQSIDEAKAESIASIFASKGFISAAGSIVVDYQVVNYIIYQEVAVTVTQTIPMPVDLSFIGFPRTITLTQEASAVIQNGDEFVRNIDIAKDMVIWLDKKLGISDSLSGALGKIGEMGSLFGF